MNDRKVGCFAAACALALACLAGPTGARAAQPAIDRFAALLPAETPLLVVSAEPAQLQAAFSKTAFFKIYQAESMQPFWSDIRSKRGGVLPTERLGLPWNELCAACSSGAAYVRLPTKNDGVGELLLVACEGKNQAAIAARDAAAAQWKARKLTVKNVKLGDIKLGGIEAIEGRSKTSRVRVALVDHDMLVICDRLAVAEAWLALSKTALSKNLAQSELYAKSRMPTDKPDDALQLDDGALEWYADPWALWRASLNPLPMADKVAKRRLKFYERQQFTAVAALGGAALFATEQYDAAYELRAVVRQPLAQGAGMLSFAVGKSFAAPAWAPAGAATDLFQWNVPAAVKAYGAIYDQLYAEDYQGAFDELLQSIETEADGPQALIRRDIFERLDAQVLRVVDYAGKPTKTNPAGRRMLLAAATSDPGKTATALERFFADEERAVKLRKGEAVVFQAAKASEPLFASRSDNPLSMSVDAVAVGRGHFFLTTDRELLELALIGPTPNSTSPAMQRAREYLDKTAGPSDVARGVRDLQAQARADFVLARQNVLGDSDNPSSLLLHALLLARPADSEDPSVDVALLPDFDAVSKFWGLETLRLQKSPEGWRLLGKMHSPEK